MGYSKALLLADAATGKISIYPEKEFLITDKGGEFEKNLDKFLAQYNITLLSISSHQKGSTGIAESNIRLSKAALRRVQIIDPSNWSFSIPLITRLYYTARLAEIACTLTPHITGQP